MKQTRLISCFLILAIELLTRRPVACDLHAPPFSLTMIINPDNQGQSQTSPVLRMTVALQFVVHTYVKFHELVTILYTFVVQHKESYLLLYANRKLAKRASTNSCFRVYYHFRHMYLIPPISAVVGVVVVSGLHTVRL